MDRSTGDRLRRRKACHPLSGRRAPASRDPAILPRQPDEADRFAIGAHRTKRAKSFAASPLDEVPGTGPSRKRALLMHFGTARAVKAAALEDLAKVLGISRATAQGIYDYFHPRG